MRAKNKKPRDVEETARPGGFIVRRLDSLRTASRLGLRPLAPVVPAFRPAAPRTSARSLGPLHAREALFGELSAKYSSAESARRPELSLLYLMLGKALAGVYFKWLAALDFSFSQTQLIFQQFVVQNPAAPPQLVAHDATEGPRLLQILAAPRDAGTPTYPRPAGSPLAYTREFVRHAREVSSFRSSLIPPGDITRGARVDSASRPPEDWARPASEAPRPFFVYLERLERLERLLDSERARTASARTFAPAATFTPAATFARSATLTTPSPEPQTLVSSSLLSQREPGNSAASTRASARPDTWASINQYLHLLVAPTRPAADNRGEGAAGVTVERGSLRQTDLLRIFTDEQVVQILSRGAADAFARTRGHADPSHTSEARAHTQAAEAATHVGSHVFAHVNPSAFTHTAAEGSSHAAPLGPPRGGPLGLGNLLRGMTALSLLDEGERAPLARPRHVAPRVFVVHGPDESAHAPGARGGVRRGVDELTAAGVSADAKISVGAKDLSGARPSVDAGVSGDVGVWGDAGRAGREGLAMPLVVARRAEAWEARAEASLRESEALRGREESLQSEASALRRESSELRGEAERLRGETAALWVGTETPHTEMRAQRPLASEAFARRIAETFDPPPARGARLSTADERAPEGAGLAESYAGSSARAASFAFAGRGGAGMAALIVRKFSELPSGAQFRPVREEEFVRARTSPVTRPLASARAFEFVRTHASLVAGVVKHEDDEQFVRARTRLLTTRGASSATVSWGAGDVDPRGGAEFALPLAGSRVLTRTTGGVFAVRTAAGDGAWGAHVARGAHDAVNAPEARLAHARPAMPLVSARRVESGRERGAAEFAQGDSFLNSLSVAHVWGLLRSVEHDSPTVMGISTATTSNQFDVREAAAKGLTVTTHLGRSFVVGTRARLSEQMKGGRMARGAEPLAGGAERMSKVWLRGRLDVTDVLRAREVFSETRAHDLERELVSLRNAETAGAPGLSYVFTAPPQRPTVEQQRVIREVEQREVVELVKREVQTLASQQASAAAPGVRLTRTDFSKISDQVYSTLVRRLMAEKERLGLHGR